MAYWLFKTEPDEFSIQDLAGSPSGTARWDGIRNYQARNYLRDATAPDDKVFIYHSSCKQPGIVGLARVASAPYPDPSQWQPDSPYYDSKSPQDTPRWYSVDLQHLRTFSDTLPLRKIKIEPQLAAMTLLHQGRLSIQPVTNAQASIILQMLE